MKTKLFIALLFGVSMLFSGDTGKIVGQITDSETGEALFGVNILLKGTTMGSASAMEGNYIILNVPAASYTISASYNQVYSSHAKLLFSSSSFLM